MKPTLLFVSALVIAGCATQSTPNPIPYVPVSVTNPPPKPIDVGPDPIAQLPAEVRSAIEQDKQPVLRQGITTIYPYDDHGQPTVNCQILRVTEIVLAPDETAKPDDVGIGDSERWSIKVTANRVLVKPKEPGIATDLVVVTNQRSYHFMLRTRTPYQTQISFYYPDEIRAAEAHHRDLIRQAIAQASEPKSSSKPLNFDYTIKGPPVPWKPILAFDDGDHFYLEFPQNIAGTDMPTLMSRQGEQQETVNYEVRGQYYVADRLLPSAVLTSGTGANRQAVQITASR
jgi:type IV secretion system protein TrbG